MTKMKEDEPVIEYGQIFDTPYQPPKSLTNFLRQKKKQGKKSSSILRTFWEQIFQKYAMRYPERSSRFQKFSKNQIGRPRDSLHESAVPKIIAIYAAMP